ncbi:MAG: tetratricopeptide repeat protein [Pseudomonadota bacterium]
MTDRLFIAVVVASLLAGPLAAQEPEPSEPSAEVEEAPASSQPAPPAPVAQDAPLSVEAARAEMLDALFVRLSNPDASDWESVQTEINAIWNQSGSPSMDLLARRADRAMRIEDFETAHLHLDDLVRLAPEFAEGWNKRATVYFLQGDYGASLEDIAETLLREPRHFGALSGLGVILDRVGDSEGALEAYRRAHKLHPNLPGAQQGIQKLEKEVEGERL